MGGQAGTVSHAGEHVIFLGFCGVRSQQRRGWATLLLKCSPQCHMQMAGLGGHRGGCAQMHGLESHPGVRDTECMNEQVWEAEAILGGRLWRTPLPRLDGRWVWDVAFQVT